MLERDAEPEMPVFILPGAFIPTGDENAKSAYCGLLRGSHGERFGRFRADY
jgi:hypothetical protein